MLYTVHMSHTSLVWDMTHTFCTIFWHLLQKFEKSPKHDVENVKSVDISNNSFK